MQLDTSGGPPAKKSIVTKGEFSVSLWPFNQRSQHTWIVSVIGLGH